MYLAICDDEISQITEVSQFLETYRQKKLPSLHWSAFQTGFSLLTALDHGENFDAILLDICMNDMNGMEVAQIIRKKNNHIPILFLTSSPDYAIESYQVEAIDYALKPINQSKIFRSLDKLVNRLELEEKRGIIVKNADGGMTKVFYNQLMYLEAMGHYGVLYLNNETSIQTLHSFSSLLRQLEKIDNFIQIHRSYAVNLNSIHRVEKNAIVLLDGTSLPLPRSRYQEVVRQFQKTLFEGSDFK